MRETHRGCDQGTLNHTPLHLVPNKASSWAPEQNQTSVMGGEATQGSLGSGMDIPHPCRWRGPDTSGKQQEMLPVLLLHQLP